MTALDPLPFGAESPDEVLAAYANGSLDPEARLQVERWLAAHPEWRPRLDVYRSIAAAVRSSAASAAAPSLDELPGLWAAIDATPQPRALRPTAPPPPPPPPTSLGYGAPGRRGAPRGRSSLLLALAAALLVAVAAAAVVITIPRRTNDDVAVGREVPAATLADVETGGGAAEDAEPTADTDPAPSAPAPTTVVPPAATGGVDPDGQALQDGAEATASSSTAATELNAVATLDLTGTSVAELAGEDVITVTVAGQGQIAFPDRSKLESTTTIDGGLLSGSPETTSEIEVEGRRWIACNGGDFVEQVIGGPEPACTGLDLGPDLAGPGATLDLLQESEGDIQNLGTEVIDGVDTTHYRFTSTLEDSDAGSVPVTVDAWLGQEDDVLRQITASTQLQLPLDLFGESLSIPTTLVLTVNLRDFGQPVDITPPD